MAVRIAGVVLPSGKHAEIALTYIYGIGRTKAQTVLDSVKIARNKKIDDLSEVELDLIRDEIKTSLVEGDLRRFVAGNIKRLQEIRCYRGVRHQKRLPVRGQSTKTNARTRKGKSVAIAGKKK